MKIKEVLQEIEKLAPLAYAEDFDNVGLLVGNKNAEVKGILIAHDALESVIEEAIEKKCNLIISYHPIIFKGLKSLTGKTYVERAVMKALKNDIAIYAIHTALDNSFEGMNAMICKKLNLKNRQVLMHQAKTIKKLVTYVPKKQADQVRQAIFDAGAGNIGNYDHCSFNIAGKGSFKGNENSNPTLGEKGKLHFEEEIQLNITFPKHRETAVISALKQAHPYEEVAYEIYQIENKNQHIGIGMIGERENPISEKEFLQELKNTFNLSIIRHSKLLNKEIKKIAVLGGSGSFGISAAKSAQADIFITGDLKYHDFFQAENQIVLADIGHYETEQFTKELLHSYLIEKFRNFAIVLSEENTNPIQYT